MWPRLGLFVPGSPCVKDEPLAGFPYKSSRLREATRLSRLYSSPSGHRQRVTANFPAGKSYFSQLQTQGLASPTACSRSSAFQNKIPREAQAPPLQLQGSHTPGIRALWRGLCLHTPGIRALWRCHGYCLRRPVIGRGILIRQPFMIPREAQAPPSRARTRLPGGSMAKISSAAAGRNFRACKNDAENSASPPKFTYFP